MFFRFAKVYLMINRLVVYHLNRLGKTSEVLWTVSSF